MERSVGIVGPLPVVEKTGARLVLRKTRFAPKKYEYQLLFTVGLHAAAGFELAVCLPRAWPLNRAALKLPRFSWPADLLLAVATAVLRGEKFAPGNLLESGVEPLAKVAVPASVGQWLVSGNNALDSGSDDKTLPRTLLLTPILVSRPLNTSKSKVMAEKMRTSKWKAICFPKGLLEEKLGA